MLRFAPTQRVAVVHRAGSQTLSGLQLTPLAAVKGVQHERLDSIRARLPHLQRRSQT